MNHSEAMHQTPIDIETVDRLKRESGIANVGKSSIRELVKLVVQTNSTRKKSCQDGE